MGTDVDSREDITAELAKCESVVDAWNQLKTIFVIPKSEKDLTVMKEQNVLKTIEINVNRYYLPDLSSAVIYHLSSETRTKISIVDSSTANADFTVVISGPETRAEQAADKVHKILEGRLLLFCMYCVIQCRRCIQTTSKNDAQGKIIKPELNREHHCGT